MAPLAARARSCTAWLAFRMETAYGDAAHDLAGRCRRLARVVQSVTSSHAVAVASA